MSVINFPNYKIDDVEACLRTLADRISNGQEAAVRAIVVLEAEDGRVTYAAFGPNLTRAYGIGIMLMAQNLILGNDHAAS